MKGVVRPERERCIRVHPGTPSGLFVAAGWGLNEGALYGWYDTVTLACHDPGETAGCPYCGDPIRPGDRRLNVFADEDLPGLRYFYRTHTSCDRAASRGLRAALVRGVQARIERERPLVR